MSAKKRQGKEAGMVAERRGANLPGPFGVKEARRLELDYCRENLLYFVRTYCRIEDKDAAEIIRPFDLWPRQEEALLGMRDHKLSIILKARQLGVTWLTLAYGLWRMLRPGYLALALSRTEEEAKELVRRLGVMLQNLPELVREDTRENAGFPGIRFRCTALSAELLFPDGGRSVFKAFPSASGAGRSFTANLLLLDEWAFQASAREIWLSAFPTINRPGGGQVVGLSTIERGTLFEELWTGDNDFYKIFLPWDADPRRTPQWYEATRRALGDLVMQEYPATPEEALTIPGGAFFPEFTRHVHVAPPRGLEGARRYASIDYGLDMLAVLWYAVFPGGGVLVYRELYRENLPVTPAAQAILGANMGEDITAWFAPPDLWNRNRDTGVSTAEAWGRLGIRLVKTSNRRDQGCLNIKEYLLPGAAGPRLRVADGAAPNLCRCLTAVQRDKNRPNEYAGEPHELTHIVDSLRAFCTGRPLEPAAPGGWGEGPGYPEQVEALLDYRG